MLIFRLVLVCLNLVGSLCVVLLNGLVLVVLLVLVLLNCIMKLFCEW